MASPVTVLGAVLVSLAVTASARGDLIAEFNFDDRNAVVDYVAAGVSSSNFIDGQGVGADYRDRNAEIRRFAGTNSVWDALDHNDYVEFTLTADPGEVLDVSSLTFDHYHELLGPVNYQLQVNGTLVGSPGLIPVLDGGALIDLSAFTNQASLTFRLLGWNALSNNVLGGWVIDNVRVNGSIRAMPEPASLVLVSVGAPMLWWLRRRGARAAASDG